MKSIGKCVYNSLWIGRCFSKESLQKLKPQAVICSGSTLGSFVAVDFYIATMLLWMDTVQCWRKGIESDQGKLRLLQRVFSLDDCNSFSLLKLLLAVHKMLPSHTTVYLIIWTSSHFRLSELSILFRTFGHRVR